MNQTLRRPFVVGLDVGTQGVRGIAADQYGTALAEASSPLRMTVHGDGRVEQSPEDWWSGVKRVLQEIVRSLKASGVSPEGAEAIAVSGTSGTVLLAGADHQPTTQAVMYSDRRCQSVVPEVQEAFGELRAKLGYDVSSSFAIAKLVWLARCQKDVWERSKHVVHAVDFVNGRLSGVWGLSDSTSVLKTGYDLVRDTWPIPILRKLGLDEAKFPQVVAPGVPIGPLRREVADEVGLPSRCMVVAGLTDGCAAQAASGAVGTHQWNSSLGTTWTVKGTAEDIVLDPLGRLYNHKGFHRGWLPGAASSTGTRWIKDVFPSVQDFRRWDAEAVKRTPTDWLVYPLSGRGERFPFIHPDAEGFLEGPMGGHELDLYAAHLEGFALLERIGFEEIERMGAPVGDTIYVTGGAAQSVPWLQLRADVLEKSMCRPRDAHSAKGAAVIAGAFAWHGSAASAAKQMISFDVTVEPLRLGAWLEKTYQMRAALKSRGWS